MKKGKGRKGAAPPEPGLDLLLPIPAAAWAAALWLVLVAGIYAGKGLAFSAHDWAGLLGLLAAAPRVLGGGLAADLLLAAGLWAGASGLGGALRRALAGPGRRGLETFLIDAALGLGALSLALLAMGLAGLFSSAALRAFYAVVVLAGCALHFRGGDEAARPRTGVPLGRSAWAAAGVVSAAAAANLMASAAPEVFYDSLVYHLALPKLYLLRGGVVATPENVYSGLPQGVQMLFALALAASGDRLASLLHAVFGLGAAAACFACAGRLAGARAGALAALLFYLCPLVIYASWGCGVDLASAFYMAAAACVLTSSPGRPWGAAALAGLLAGFAAGTKFNTAPAVALLVLGHFWLERRAGRDGRGSVLMAAAAGLAVLPWLLKNAAFYGNPLYPFLHERLGSAKPADWQPFLDAAGGRALGSLLTAPGLWSFLSQPLRCSLGDWPLGDWPGPVFVALVPWALAARWRWTEAGEDPPAAWRLVAALAAGGTLAWWLASSLVRYLVPSLPLLACAVALAVERGPWPAWARRLGWAAALIGSLLAFQCAWRQGGGIGQWDYLRGRVSRTSYLGSQRVTYGLPYHPAAEWINGHLPQTAKVLLLGESRGYYLERDFIAATVFDHNPFWQAAEAAKDDAELRGRLRGLGVTHLLVSVRQLHLRRDSKAILPRELGDGPLVDAFVRRWLDKAWELRRDDASQPSWLVVYELRSEPRDGPGPLNVFKVVVDILRRQGA